MQSTRAAKWNQSECARVMSAFNRNVPQRAFHVCVDHLKHALRRFARAYFPLCCSTQVCG
jgi:hypothetical protein